MLDRNPVLDENNNIIGFKKWNFHLLDIYHRRGKTQSIIKHIKEGDFDSILIIDKKNQDSIKNAYFNLKYKETKYYLTYDIEKFLSGLGKVDYVLVDNYFSLSLEEKRTIKDYCRKYNCILNAYGVSPALEMDMFILGASHIPNKIEEKAKDLMRVTRMDYTTAVENIRKSLNCFAPDLKKESRESFNFINMI